MRKKTKDIILPPRLNSLRDMVDGTARMYGDKVHYRYRRGKELHAVTYNDQKKNVDALGTAFYSLGLMGKRIAVIGNACPEYMETYYAAVCGGGVIIPLDKDLGDEELCRFIVLSEAEAIVYTGAFNEKLPGFSDRIPAVRYFIPIEPDPAKAAAEPAVSDTDGKKVMVYSDLIALGQKALEGGERAFVDCKPDMDKMCALLFTSGTTGTSKGVVLSNRNITAAVNASVYSMAYDRDDVFVDLLPMHHSYEVTCGHMGISAIGGELYINDSLKNTMRSIAYAKPTALMVVPLYVETMHKRVWAEIEKKKMTGKVKAAMKLSEALFAVGIDVRRKLFRDVIDGLGGNLYSIVVGGAPISPQIVKDFHAFGIDVLEGYGITECAPLVAVNRPEKVRYHSVGQPVDGCTVKIDLDGSSEGRDGTPAGEILVKGGNVMTGYYENPEATAAVFTEDGWFRTGDIGYIDPEGYIFITGRKKNVIILSNGKNVFPEELEEHLSHSPLVSECVVVGRTHDNGETVITAVIYPDPDAVKETDPEKKKALLKEEVNNINRTLPVYKQIRDVELRDTEFEKTTSRKIKRFLVK